MSDEYRNHHYVPRWYQKKFLLPGEHELYYLDLKPGTFSDPRGVTHTTKALKKQGTRKCFVETDLYTTKIQGMQSRDFEKYFFGEIDAKGMPAVNPSSYSTFAFRMVLTPYCCMGFFNRIMKNRIISYIKQSASTLGFIAGVSLLILAFLFIKTGYDEIWNGQRLWMYGLVWLAILIVNGASLLGFSLGRVKCSLRYFVILNAVLFGMLILALALDL